MAVVKVRIDDRELRRKLRELGTVVSAKQLRGSLRKAATVVKKRAIELVPVDSGELKRSIRVRTKRVAEGFAAFVEIGGKGGPGRDDPGWYAHLVEFGTSPHFQKRSKRFGGKEKKRVHPGTAPRPYLRPALDEKSSEAVKVFREDIRRRLNKLSRPT